MSGLRETWSFLGGTLRRFAADGCGHRSAAIAYYALLSSGPALIIGVWVLTWFTGSSPKALDALLVILGDLLPAGQEGTLDELVGGFKVPDSLVALMVPLLMWTAVLVFLEVEKAVSAIFRTAEVRLLVLATLKTFVFFAVCGGILVGTFLAHGVLLTLTSSGALPAGRFLPWLVSIVLPLGSTLVVFAFVYWFLPQTRVLPRHALVGGATAAALWEVAKHIYGAVVSRAPTYGLFYGPLSLLVVTLVWAYLSSAILLLGAEAVALRGEQTDEKAKPRR